MTSPNRYLSWLLFHFLITFGTGQYHECPATDTTCLYVSGLRTCDAARYMTACSTPLTSDCNLPCIPTPIQSPFVYVNETVNFYQAMRRCQAIGMVLVSIHNQTEANDAANLCNVDSNNACWIGLYRDVNETDFNWIDGSDSTDYDFPWYPHQPDLTHSLSACAVIEPVSGTWFDWNCDESITGPAPFICGPQRPTPQPTYGPTTNAPTSNPIELFHECPATDTNCIVATTGYRICDIDAGYISNCTLPLTSNCDDPCILKPMKSPFVYVAEFLNFTQAIQRCQDMGMVLVSIHNQTEADDAYTLCWQNKFGFCWLGLYRNANEADFHWIDGSDSTDYAFPWFLGIDGISLDVAACGIIDVVLTEAWLDVDCEDTFNFGLPFICGPQRPITTLKPTPSPTSPFVYVDESVTFDEAIQECRNMGMVLVSIHNQTEADYVATLCDANSATDACWIGLFRHINQPDFKWIDGSDPTDYDFPWNGNSPAVPLSVSACGAVDGDAGTWFDVPYEANGKLPFICGPQRPMTTPQPIPTAIGPTPEPTSRPSTNEPTSKPTPEPTTKQTTNPTTNPTIKSILNPTLERTTKPTSVPTLNPTLNLHPEPTMNPTSNPIELFHECPGWDTSCHTDYNLGYRICDERYLSACLLPLTSHCDEPCIFIGPFHECTGTDTHCHTNYSLGYTSGIRECDAGYITNCSLPLISDCDDSCKSMSPSNAPTSHPTVNKAPFDECPHGDPGCYPISGYRQCIQGFITACSTPLTSHCNKSCIPIPITSPFVYVHERVTFDEAIQKCHDMGMVLVSIHNETEAFQVTALCNQHSIQHCWIGLHRDANEVDSKWIDRSNSTDYHDFPWSWNNPNVDLNRSACVILDSLTPTWDDIRCEYDYKIPFICGPQRATSKATSSVSPTSDQSLNPSSEPTMNPTFEPSLEPTTRPSDDPSMSPTSEPTLIGRREFDECPKGNRRCLTGFMCACPTPLTDDCDIECIPIRSFEPTPEPTVIPTTYSPTSSNPTDHPIIPIIPTQNLTTNKPLIIDRTFAPTTTPSTSYYTTRHPTKRPTRNPTYGDKPTRMPTSNGWSKDSKHSKDSKPCDGNKKNKHKDKGKGKNKHWKTESNQEEQDANVYDVNSQKQTNFEMESDVKDIVIAVVLCMFVIISIIIGCCIYRKRTRRATNHSYDGIKRSTKSQKSSDYDEDEDLDGNVMETTVLTQIQSDTDTQE